MGFQKNFSSIWRANRNLKKTRNFKYLLTVYGTISMLRIFLPICEKIFGHQEPPPKGFSSVWDELKAFLPVLLNVSIICFGGPPPPRLAPIRCISQLCSHPPISLFFHFDRENRSARRTECTVSSKRRCQPQGTGSGDGSAACPPAWISRSRL